MDLNINLVYDIDGFEYTIKVDDKKMFEMSIFNFSPEDHTIERDCSALKHRMEDLLKTVYNAGKENKELNITFVEKEE